MLILKPYWIAEECFLWEAYLWVAFNRFPLSEIIPDMVDVRFYKDYIQEYEPHIPDHSGYIESAEAARAGLPPNPEWEALLAEPWDDIYTNHTDPDFIVNYTGHLHQKAR